MIDEEQKDAGDVGYRNIYIVVRTDASLRKGAMGRKYDTRIDVSVPAVFATRSAAKDYISCQADPGLSVVKARNPCFIDCVQSDRLLEIADSLEQTDICDHDSTERAIWDACCGIRKIVAGMAE